MKVRALAYGGGSVLNAIATWKGSAFALNLPVEVTVEVSERLEAEGLLRSIYEVVSERCELPPVKFEVKSSLPKAGGLKSSSAVANAATQALFKLCGMNVGPYQILEASVEAAKRAKVTVTGAFDDASASLLGGLVITDNKEMVVEERLPLKVKAVVLPKGGRGLGYEEIERRLKAFKKEFWKVYELLKRGEVFEAMTLNGLLVGAALGYDLEPVRKALEAGALSASISGNGPSIVALVEDNVEEVVEALKPFGEVLVTEVVNEPAYLR